MSAKLFDRDEKDTTQEEFFLIILITLTFCLIIYTFYDIKVSRESTLSSGQSFTKRTSRIHTSYKHKLEHFPLKIIILNELECLLPALKRCIKDFNAISCLPSSITKTGRCDYFQLVPIHPSDLQPDKSYDGGTAKSLCLKYGAKLSIAVLGNTHVHGKFEKNEKKYDVLAHASLPTPGCMYICLDIENVSLFKSKWQFLKNIIAHEMGHILGLGEIEYDPVEFSENHPIRESIMSSDNLSRKQLFGGINNEYDLESLHKLYF